MNHERPVGSGGSKRARGWSGWCVEGSSKNLCVLRRQCVPRLQIDYTYGLALNRGTQERRLVHGQRKRGTLNQIRQSIIVANLSCLGPLCRNA